MKKSRNVAVTVVFGLIFVLSPVVRAEMEQHHDGEHHMRQSHHERHDQDEAMDAHATGADAIMDNYFAIQSALAADSMEGVSERAKALADEIEAMHGKATEDGHHSHGASMHVLMKGIAEAAKTLAKKKDIASAREVFGELSEKMIAYQRELGEKGTSEARVFVCDMAQKSWLQNSDEIRNPYYGSKMLRCGREVQEK